MKYYVDFSYVFDLECSLSADNCKLSTWRGRSHIVHSCTVVSHMVRRAAVSYPDFIIPIVLYLELIL